MTTDDASVIVEAGTLVPCYHQLCVAHGIQLAVVKILYREISNSEVDPMERSSIEMDDDDSEYMDELDDKQSATDKMGQQDTVLSNDLSDALRVKIKERRTIVTDILTHLHNPKKYEEYLRQADGTFFMPKNMKLQIKKIISRFLS
ncbi:hypothetical protein HHI36_014738 [Cryptolaemus montrouzieri]|uniref:Uncharacterized protein n=1 Tax=Cryptolaemus montrouzieri TaxID=559131 RepID=A0ABD2N3Q2_9CUCU